MAQEGFVVKWKMRVEGVGLNAQNKDVRGTLIWEHEIYDVNAKIEIKPPAGASPKESLGADIPVPKDAKQMMSGQGMVIYQVPGMTVEKAVEFYKTELPRKGFEFDEDGSVVDEDAATLMFKGNGLEAIVAITVSGKDVQVMVNTSEAQ